jgi:CBS domain-containing protein
MSPLASAPPAPRVDSYPYRRTLAEVMSAPAVFAPSDTSLRDAARLLLEKRISSVLIDMDGQPGIVTERDLLRGFSAENDHGKPVSLRDLASCPLHALPASSYLYRAIGRVNRLNIRHLAVSGPGGEIVGMVTPRSLLRERATDAIMLGDEIDSAKDGPALAAARARLTSLARGLIDDGMDGQGVCRVVSAELCGMTRRAAELAEERMADEGRGAPPVPYAVMVLGSGGRGESLLAPDQDNAIVFESGEAGGPEDEWFASLGGHIADMLDEAGVPYCKGGIMARNPQWRKSKADWRRTVDMWVRQSRPEDLLNVDIFFDGIAVHGKLALAEQIWRYAYEQGHHSTVFQKLMTELARNWRSPLGLLGGFRSDRGDRTDLKLGALMPIFTGARVLSIRHHIPALGTAERLRGAAAAGAFRPETADDIIAAHQVILKTILAQQFRDAGAGVPLSNYVETGKLSAPEKRRLREAVKTIDALMDAVSEARL